jgi:peptidoglycan/LPS O-acetylase OafA/YrhL
VLSVVGYSFTRPSLSGSDDGTHLPEFAGGFLGVDLLLVLGGFLVTAVLLRELDDTGRIGVKEFWRRRAKRVLPALVPLLAVVALVGAVSHPAPRSTLRWDVVAALGGVLNWRLVATGQPGFEQGSPVQHLWALGLGEQCYLLWPLLVVGAVLLIARRPEWGQFVLLALGVTVVISVMVLAITYDPNEPARAFYSTDSRLHEVLIGALAAIGVAQWRPRVALATLFGLVGLGGVLWLMAALTDRAAGYYRGGSVLFCLAAAALIIGLLDERTVLARALSLRPLRFVGTMAYGIYLWHWPVVVWLSPDTIHRSGWKLIVLRTLALAAAALLSHHLLERVRRVKRVKRAKPVQAPVGRRGDRPAAT